MLPLIILYGLVLVAGIVSIGLYTALLLFPPPVGQEIALGSAPPSPAGSITPVTLPPTNQNPLPKTTPPEPAGPPPEIEPPAEPELPPDVGLPPIPRPFSPGEGPGGVGGRSEKFREARKAILREGQQPDFNQFEGREREMLERMWERYQRTGGGGPGRGGGPIPGGGKGRERGGPATPSPLRNR